MLIIRNIYINEEKAAEFNKIREMKGAEIKAKYGYQPGIFLSEKVDAGPEMEAEFRVIIREEDKPYTEIVLLKNGEEIFRDVHLRPRDTRVTVEEDGFDFDYENMECLFIIYILKELADEEAAKQYAIECFKKCEVLKAKIGEEIVLLSGKYNPYKRYFYPFIEDVIQDKMNCPELDIAELSDKFAEAFEHYCGMRLIHS